MVQHSAAFFIAHVLPLFARLIYLRSDSDAPLKIGDYVTLRAKRIHAFLSAEGILDQRVFVQTEPNNYDDCRFQVCAPNQYSAARELEEWEEKLRKVKEKQLLLTGEDVGDEKSLEEQNLDQLLGDGEEADDEDMDEDTANENLRQSMMRGKESEFQLNLSTMKRETGNPVKFGENYQLRHVKSGRYLTMSPKEIAKVEKQNMKMYLDENGNSNSHFTINPKHKIDKAGDPVCSSHDIELVSTENRGKFLNFSQAEVQDMAGHREINCALAAQTFAIYLYAEYQEPDVPDLCCSDIVRLRDPEKNALLRLLPLPSSTDGEDAMKDKDRYDLYLETQSEHSSQESNALWILEAKHPHLGGQVEFASEPTEGPWYRLRHLNTGRYIATRFNDNFESGAKGAGARPSSRPGSRGGGGVDATQYLCTTRPIKSQKLTEITFTSAKTQRSDSTAKPVLKTGEPVKMCINGRYLTLGGQHEGLQAKFAEPGEYLYCCGASEDPSVVLNLNVERADDEGTVIDALCGVCALPHIQAFANLVKKKNAKSVQTEIEGDFKELMSSLINYLRGEPFSSEVDFRKKDHIYPSPKSIQPAKQVFLREQAVLTEILDICHYLLEPFWKASFPELKVEITKMCLAVLLNAIASNSANQMHVADRLPIFIGHVATHTLATRCIVEMLEKNKELQEDKVNEAAVTKFIDMIKSSNMRAEYLDLLKAVCSCKGKGVDDNQCMVAQQWLTDSRELQILLETDNRKVASDFSLFNPNWVPKDLGDKSTAVGSDFMAGFEIFKTKIVPQVKIGWVTDDPMFDPNSLGGALGKISIEKILSTDMLTMGGGTTATAVRIKKRIADYFIAQLNLAAEVCLDRNYVAIELCEATLDFNDLFSILKTPELDELLYAAVVRVITCIHVDRDPQSSLRIPRLSRILVEEPKSELELRMPAVDPDRENYFALLQDMIEEHLSMIDNQVGDVKGSEYDLRVMQLLKQLVQFRFYSKHGEVNKLITPLVASLDLRSGGGDYAAISGGSRSGTANSMTRTSSRQSMTPKKSATILPDEIADDDILATTVPAVTYPVDGHPKKIAIFNILDHIAFVAFIIIVTVVGIALSFAIPNTPEKPNPAMQALELTMTAFFAVELIIRMHCFSYAKGPIGTPMDSPAPWNSDFKEPNPPTFFSDGYGATDFWVVVLDVLSTILMAGRLLDALGFNPGTVARAARIMRVLKVSKMLKAARFVGKVKELNKTVDMSDWQLPERYASTGVLKMETMLETVDVLREITNSTRDFSMSLLLNKWQQWDLGQNQQGTPKKPDELFIECFDELKSRFNLSLDSDMEEFDLVFLDLCLYKYSDLVQSSLNVLMIHHNLRYLMLDDVTHSQLLVKEADERLGNELKIKLADLQSCAEQAELWAELEKPEDRKINDKVKKILRELADHCRLQTSKLNGAQIYRPNVKFQNLLRNLGAFEVAMTVLELEETLSGDDDEEEEDGEGGGGDEEGNDQEVQENTREILRLCNIFLSWFVKHNTKNQELAFVHLDTFTDYLSGGFGASKIVAEIFRGNEKLVKQFPPKLYNACADLLVKDMNPDILDVFEALMWMPHHDAPNNYQVQREIFKVLTDPNRQEKIMYLCTNPDGDEYAERKRFCQDAARNLQQMAADGSFVDDEYAHMPRMLSYHVKLLQVLSGTAIGRTSITEIEAKLQTMYNENDVCEALLDPESTMDMIIPLAHFLYYAIIEVEIAVSGLGKNKFMWRFLIKCIETLRGVCVEGGALDFLQTHYRDSSSEAVAARKKALYAITCAQIVGGFFEKYYKPEHMDESFSLVDPPEPDPNAEDDADGRMSPGLDSLNDGGDEEETLGSAFGPHVHMWWHDVIADLQQAMSAVYTFQCKVFTQDHYKILFESIDQCVMAMDDDTRSQLNIARPDDLESICESVEASMKDIGEDDEEPEKGQSYLDFIEQIRESEKIQELIMEDKAHMVKSLQSVPSFADNVDADLRLEPLIQKLVDHTRSRLIIDGDHSKYLDPDCTRSTKWFVTLFRLMIEDQWGMTIEERDEDGDDTQDKAAAATQGMLDKFGATTLCVDLISAGIDSELVLECIKLLVALLFKEGGATEVQTTIFNHLNKGQSQLFFEELEDIMDKMMKYYKNEKYLPGIEPEETATALGAVTTVIAEMPPQEEKDEKSKGEGEGGEEEEDELPDPLEEIPIVADNIITVRFMQLMCEGHFEPNQEILRYQKNNGVQVNTLGKMVKFMQELSKSDKQCRASTAAATALGDLILEVIQGPCIGNQEYFADSELIEILNRIMRNKPANDCDEDEEDDLKAICLNILEALCEGQVGGSKIYERILSVIDLEVLRVMILSGDPGEELNECQTEALVLLQMFFDYRPTLRDEVQLPPRINQMMGRDVTSVEVIWHNQLQRRFFSKPSICNNLAKATRDDLVVVVNRNSLEEQLLDFVERTQEVYLELQWQDRLQGCELSALGPLIGGMLPDAFASWGPGFEKWVKDNNFDISLATVFSRTNQNNATWVAFGVASTINLIMLAFFKKIPIYAADVIDNDEWAGDDAWSDDMGNPEKYIVGYRYDSSWKNLPMASKKSGRYDFTGHRLPTDSQEIEIVLQILNLFNIALSTFTLILFLVVRVPVKYNSLLEKDVSQLWAFIKAVTDRMTLYYFAYTFVALLAMLHSPVWQGVLLLDIIVKDTTTQAVLLAVVIPWKSLIMTFLLAFFVIYIFAFWIFIMFPADFEGSSACDTLRSCVVMSFNWGIRSSGGVGDWMNFDLADRWWMDVLYFILVLVILLNVVFGIIIDTFSELRSDKTERLRKTENYCFICGIDKLKFDRNSDGATGFKDHIQNDHYMWDYLFFIVFIFLQDKDDDDGLEYYVRNLIDNGDIKWFPMNKAMVFDTDANEEESVNDKITSTETKLVEHVTEQSQPIKETLDEMAVMMKKVSENLVKLDDRITNMEKNGIKSTGGGGGGGGGGEDEPRYKLSIPVTTANKPSNVTGAPPDSKQAVFVQVVDAMNLVKPHLLGSTDPFVSVSIFWNGSKVGDSETIWFGSEHPQWKNDARNTFTIPISGVETIATSVLVAEVNHAHRRGAGHFLGCVQISGADLMTYDGQKQYYRLQKKTGLKGYKQAMVQGDLALTVVIKS